VTPKEQRLIRIALVIFVVFATVQLFPATKKFVGDYWQHIEDMQKDIEKSKKLRDEAEYWKTEHEKAKQIHDTINRGLIDGDSSQLVGVNMQKLLNDLARETGIIVRTMDPPKTEVAKSEKWMLIIQALQFEANSKSLMTFLKALETPPQKFASKKWIVSSLNIRGMGERLNGTLQITGFSRLTPRP